ncbi:MAG: GNAT family N-acetyltransferase [Alphaproteobacteria bacterium]|nr:GNAT family N-acetyltransferase [Alphaproteobacteria bacterium]
MIIKTPRLLLRTPTLTDAARMTLLAGDYDVARMTGTIPHPYTEQQAAEWIDSVLAGEEGVVFAIERDGELIGCTGYRPFSAKHAELGYWIGKPYWGRGYGTEAVAALIAHAFEADGFIYLAAGHFTDNPASERVLRKLGFIVSGSEMRDCAARRTRTPCMTYRLDRASALAGLGTV